MFPKSEAKAIQSKILFISTFTLLISALLIAVIAIYPLYNQLKERETHNLNITLTSTTQFINEFLLHLEDVVKQIGSRSTARQLVIDYGENKISKDEYIQKLKVILNDSININPQILSITRIDIYNKTKVTVGKLNYSELNSNTSFIKKTTLNAPVKLNGKMLFTIQSPVLDRANNIIANDIIVFELHNLYSNLNIQDTNSTGSIKFGFLLNKKINLFYPNDDSAEESVNNQDHLIQSAFIKAAHLQQKGMISGYIDNKKYFVSYAPLQVDNWAVLIVASSDTILNKIRIILFIVILFIFISIIISSFILKYKTTPLFNQLLTQDHEIQRINLQLREKNKQLKYLTFHDNLTRIPSEHYFNLRLDEEISRSKRFQHPFSLIYIDVNNLKRINETLGYECGDMILQYIAKQLSAIIRNIDFLARIHGHRFALIAPETSDADNVNKLIEKINKLTAAPILYKDTKIYFALNISKVIFPTDANNAYEILQAAESQIFDIKSQRKSSND